MKDKKNYYDKAYEEMYYLYQSARDLLLAKTRKVIITKGVIDLYPDGADRYAAVLEFEDAQHRLLCAIGNYDGRLNDLRTYYQKHKEDFIAYWCAPDTLANSHTVIEMAYENFWKK